MFSLPIKTHGNVGHAAKEESYGRIRDGRKLPFCCLIAHYAMRV